ncbi:MAG: DUF3619 family protein [Janthinobacterium lividum]
MTNQSSNQANNKIVAKEVVFARKLAYRLDQNLDNLPAASIDRLAAARAAALARKKDNGPLPAFAPATRAVPAGGGRGILSFDPGSWFGRFGIALPLVVLVAGLIGLYQGEQDQRIDDLAEIDAMVLSDELPLTAYLDHGFNAYLAKKAE